MLTILSAGLLFSTKKCGAAVTKILSSEILIGILIINKRRDDKKKNYNNTSTRKVSLSGI